MLKNKTKLGRLERFHDAVQKKEEALSLFNLGYLDLENRAAAEKLFWQICEQIAREAPQDAATQPEELHDLLDPARRPVRLQFLRLPVAARPLGAQAALPHRARSTASTRSPPSTRSSSTSPATPTARSAASSTCRTCKDTLALHPLNSKPYYLGIFLIGAYQDIMGDLHNLFGRVNEVHVFLEDDEPNGFYIEEALSGSRIADVIEGVQYQQEELCRRMKAQIDAATRKDQVKPREGVRLLELYEGQMLNKTYLNIERTQARKKRPPAGTLGSRAGGPQRHSWRG